MALVSSQLYREVLGIAASGPKAVHYRYEGELVANGKTIKSLAGVAVSFLRDYLQHYAEDARIELMIPAGTFMYDIYPYRRDLKLRVYRYPQQELVDQENTTQAVLVTEYKAVLFDTNDPTVERNQMAASSKEGANMTTMSRYTFQLIDPVVEQLRLLQVGGTFRGQVPGELLRTLLTHYSQQLKFPADQKPLGVGMVEPNNKEIRQTLLIPHATPLVDQADGTYGLAKFLQFKEGGIYNAGISAFYQGRYWYVFPPFDVSRYETAKRKLTIANISPKEMRQPERSYQVQGNNVYVLVTGNVKYDDRSEHDQLNSGNGLRWSNSTKLFNNALQGEGNTAQAKRNGVMSEVVADQNPEKLAYAPMAANRVSSNSCAQLTPLAFKRGSFVQLNWENANLDILTPGMPARVLYEKDGQIQMLDGCLVAAELIAAPTGNLGAKENWLANASLTLFVTRAGIDTPKHTA